MHTFKLHLPTVMLSLTAGHALCGEKVSRVVVGHIKRSSFISPFEEVTCRASLPQLLLGLIQSCLLLMHNNSTAGSIRQCKQCNDRAAKYKWTTTAQASPFLYLA